MRQENSTHAGQRALSIQEFAEQYGIGRSSTYEELKAGRLRARKIGKRTVITVDDAEEWLRNLPRM
jgi:excisionase family DNA binding protein